MLEEDRKSNVGKSNVGKRQRKIPGPQSSWATGSDGSKETQDPEEMLPGRKSQEGGKRKNMRENQTD